ncbi:hypothetical protein GPAL_2450 [Glaciecola pallidula DSM 14239 = ACAM 615]|uniref:Uncharacterized protein n=1 Tax=Brumicola pallidula DSM 14239 = ACAM 615 TaxID=1121922 RepID=K6YZG3_9ALTE|nr:hypothetical protein GPAL_2450 [Glaciecola pallidula DSM 14239 = ACAM 615]
MKSDCSELLGIEIRFFIVLFDVLNTTLRWAYKAEMLTKTNIESY